LFGVHTSFDVTLYVIFYLTTIFITIIMLNLLIAIIGDTYEIIKAAEIEVQINKYFNNIKVKLFSIYLEIDLKIR